MVKYNHTRTAYKPDWSRYDWFLIPDGKKRAPLFGEGPRLDMRNSYPYITDEHINILSNKDRILLLESIAGGCFGRMWVETCETLRERSSENFKLLSDYASSSHGR